jgi:hypothetical protein
MAWFQARKITRELEARMTPPSTANTTGGKPGGKAERKWYGDGGERLKLHVSGLDLPDGTPVKLAIASRPVATLAVQRGRLKFDTESPPGQSVPEAREGETIAVEQGGIILVSGRFNRD